jgi:prepilin signal peptidase PulO-like enzyme (type II secretory pathway)
MIALLCAVFFGLIAYIAVTCSAFVCAGIPPADDGPPAGRAPQLFLIAGAAVLGAVMAYLKAEPLQLGVAAIVTFALVACWCSDAVCGIVPDVFTLGPLAALLFFAAAQRDWWAIVSAVLIIVPFAAAAIFSRGYGMGWGDVKLVALSGAVLGAPLAAFAMAIACAVAVIVHRFGRARTAPIAFAPYIALLTGIALPLGLTH